MITLTKLILEKEDPLTGIFLWQLSYKTIYFDIINCLFVKVASLRSHISMSLQCSVLTKLCIFTKLGMIYRAMRLMFYLNQKIRIACDIIDVVHLLIFTSINQAKLLGNLRTILMITIREIKVHFRCFPKFGESKMLSGCCFHS